MLTFIVPYTDVWYLTTIFESDAYFNTWIFCTNTMHKKYLLQVHFIIWWSELLNSLQHLYKPFTFPYKIRACLIDFLNKISHKVELLLQRIYYFLHFFRMFWCLNFHISSTNWCCLWMHSQSNRSMLMLRDPDRLRLVWPSFPQSQGVVCYSQDKCYATIPHCMNSVLQFLHRKPKSESGTKISANWATATHKHTAQQTTSCL